MFRCHTIESPRQFFRAKDGEFDALLYSAEAGSAWTLIYPQYSVVVPKPRPLTAPVAVALPLDAPRLYAFVDTWLQLQQDSGVLDELYEHWILGEGAKRKRRRWSVVRDVLGWVDWRGDPRQHGETPQLPNSLTSSCLPLATNVNWG